MAKTVQLRVFTAREYQNGDGRRVWAEECPRPHRAGALTIASVDYGRLRTSPVKISKLVPDARVTSAGREGLTIDVEIEDCSGTLVSSRIMNSLFDIHRWRATTPSGVAPNSASFAGLTEVE